MRLPQHLIEAPFFLFEEAKDLFIALGDYLSPDELAQITALVQLQLPPVTSVHTLAAMIGINPGLIWSFANRPNKHYRRFKLQKGTKVREITAPKVGLKIIQKWLSFHLAKLDLYQSHVFGFVPGRSHLEAAFVHRCADWAYSIDIENFFQTTSISLVHQSLCELGYQPQQATLICSLTCLSGFLAQGAPSSPPLSNICFRKMDEKLCLLSQTYSCKLTRYADDIVFSGSGEFPVGLKDDVQQLFIESPWRLSQQKERIEPIKGRIKIHGLIVNGREVRLTKGYRNKLRAYKHILFTRGENAQNHAKIKGHVNYLNHVNKTLIDFYRDVSEVSKKE